jgi:hypothetical protein
MEQVQSPYASRKVNSTYTAGVWRRRLKKFLRSLLGLEHEGFGAVLPKCMALKSMPGKVSNNHPDSS